MYTAKGLSEKNQLVTQSTQLVKRLAHQLKAKLPANIEVDDLIQAGMMGLLDAANRYEDNHGAQFETYAAQRIRGAMLDELRSADWLPRGVRQNMRKIEAAMNAVQQRSAKAPSESEIAKEMNIPLREYQELLSEGSGHQLIYYEDFQESGEDEHFLDRHLVDRDSDPLAALMDTGFREALIEAIENLPEREKLLMGLYYEQELNLKEIGAIMGVSESRVCQLHSQAVARLRTKLREQAWTGA